MQNAYIVASKNAKKACFSSKLAKKLKKLPFFAENWAKIAVFINFTRQKWVDSEKSQKSRFFAKSSAELFENYSIRGRVKSYSSRAIKQKTAFHCGRAAVLKS